MRFSKPELFRIGFTLVTLIGVIVMTRPCAHAVSGFVMSVDGSGSETDKAIKAKEMPKPGNVDVPVPTPQTQYEQLRPGMTEEEIKAAIERSKAHATGTGSATMPSSPSAGSAISPTPPSP
jgi:hypothetical protein